MVYRVVIDDGNAWSMNVVDARPSRLASVDSGGCKECDGRAQLAVGR
jgi:hypothetical protein